jgi:hypothetical protein
MTTWLSKVVLLIKRLLVNEILYLKAIAQMNGDTKTKVITVAVISPHIPPIYLTKSGPIAEKAIRVMAKMIHP